MTLSKKQTGFSLIEVLVAFTILVLVLPMTYKLYRQNMYSSQLQHEYFVASTIAHNKIKELTTDELKQDFEDNGIEYNHYYWKRNISTVKNSAEEIETTTALNILLKEIIVEVSWNNGEKTHDINFQTISLVSAREL